MKIMHIVGARPNFMKIAPIHRSMKKDGHFEQVLVHTGQHYDANMSAVFFDELSLPRPDVNLEVGSGSHAMQTAQIMTRFEPVLLEHQPDWVFVVGDVNSTIACALVCTKLGVKVGHVEAGLRSFDRTMPEEINRVLTDRISDLLFTPSQDGNDNLQKEGVAPERIKLVGNVMIDTLVTLLPKAEVNWQGLREKYKLEENEYILATLHRPFNVDEPDVLADLLGTLSYLGKRHKVVFPMHPRTRQRMEVNGIIVNPDQLLLIPPAGYLDFLGLQANSKLVITDSGGIQEETSYLGVPCITVRPNTERPITISMGTNQLSSNGRAEIIKKAEIALGREKKRATIPFWDGLAAERITEVMLGL